jgi:hypothetical protein
MHEHARDGAACRLGDKAPANRQGQHALEIGKGAGQALIRQVQAFVLEALQAGHQGVPGAIAGKFTVSQKCLQIKQLASPENLDHIGPAGASCGQSQSSRAAARFYYLIFTDKKRGGHQQEFLSDPTYRKFSGDCSWNPRFAGERARDSTIAGK